MLTPTHVQKLTPLIEALSHTFAFGYYGVDDIRQFCWLKAIEGMEAYDSSRPIEKFMFTHLRNRLLNLRRNKYKRSNPPCKDCYEAHINHTHPPHKDGFCTRFQRWLDTNHTKQQLACPSKCGDMGEFIEYSAHNVEPELNELRGIIDEKLPPQLRTTYLRLLAGLKVSSRWKSELYDTIKNILGDTE